MFRFNAAKRGRERETNISEHIHLLRQANLRNEQNRLIIFVFSSHTTQIV